MEISLKMVRSPALLSAATNYSYIVSRIVRDKQIFVFTRPMYYDLIKVG